MIFFVEQEIKSQYFGEFRKFYPVFPKCMSSSVDYFFFIFIYMNFIFEGKFICIHIIQAPKITQQSKDMLYSLKSIFPR